MNAVSLNNLWSYLQGLSLSASNQRWLGERLIEASAAHTTAENEEDLKLKKLKVLNNMVKVKKIDLCQLFKWDSLWMEMGFLLLL